MIRNALRYQLSNLYDFNPAHDALPDAALTGLDRWALDRFSRLEQEVIRAYDNYEFHTVYQRLSQFVAVELSAIYHDVVKDRLYTDAPASPRRRSTQTALHRMLVALCKMLSPLLAFTADEAWQFVPGKTVDAAQQLTWQPIGFIRPDTEVAAWDKLFQFRELALPELEKARQSKLIGKALEANLALGGPAPEVAVAQNHLDALRELLNVSQLELEPGGDALKVTVTKAAGDKCERCWHWETDVGANAAHPTLCGRCVQVLQQIA